MLPLDPTTTLRKPLKTAVNVITVVVAIYSKLHLVVPYLLAWAFWGLMQRSARADRRWVACAFAIPAAHLVGVKLVVLFFWGGWACRGS